MKWKFGLDVCRPAAEQGEALASLGWPAAPSAGRLMRRMAADAQLSFDAERNKKWAYSRDEYFKADNNIKNAIFGGNVEVDVVTTTDWEDFRAGLADEDHDDVDDWGGGGDHHAAPAAPPDDARA